MKRRMCAICIACILLIGVGQAFAAEVLLFDRGLPTANLNNSAGANRSNVAWADQESSATPTEYWLPGDDFTISAPGAYELSTISIWTTSAPTGLTLWGGVAGGAMAQISNSYVSSVVTYADATSYQKSSGSFTDLYKIDFTVDWNVIGGQTYQFYLDGPWSTYSSGTYVNPFLHSSNAALSGSTQEGANNQFLWLHVNNGAQVVETWDSLGSGWDKSSDANVQIYGAQVPEPSLLILLSLGIAGVSLASFRMKR